MSAVTRQRVVVPAVQQVRTFMRQWNHTNQHEDQHRQRQKQTVWAVAPVLYGGVALLVAAAGSGDSSTPTVAVCEALPQMKVLLLFLM